MKTIKADYKKIVRSEGFPIFLYNTEGEKNLIKLEKGITKGYNRIIKSFKKYFKSYSYLIN